jgi:hypothetical protein
VFSLLKDRREVLRLMLDRCRQCQISLNLKKCIFCVLFGILLGHVVCKRRIITRSNQYCSNFGVRTSYISDTVEGNSGSYRILHEVYQGIFADHNTNGNTTEEGSKVSMKQGLLEGVGHLKAETCDCTEFNFSRQEQGVPCTCRCIFHSIGCITIPTRGGRHISPNCFFQQEFVYSRE